MLTPDDIDVLTTAAQSTTENLNNTIVKKIIERLVARLERGEPLYITPTDLYQADVLMDAGYLIKDLSEEIAKFKIVGAKEIFDAFKEGFEKAWRDDTLFFKKRGITNNKPSERYLEILQRNYEKTAGEFLNMTGTTARDASQIFIRTATEAYFATMTGAMSNTEAMRDAIKKVAGANIKTVHYDSGHVNTLETAMLRAIRTGVAQTAGDIAIKRMEENGEDVVLVSAHFGARPSHQVWQGKFYSLHGKTPGLPPFVLSTGYGTVTGLCGANCRHHFGPGDLDFNPYANLGIDDEKSNKAYELSQKQRARERDIRKAKAECMQWKAAVDATKTPEARMAMEKEYAKAAEKLQRRNKAYNDFIAQHNLKPYPDRVHVAGWDRSQAGSATQAANKKIAEDLRLQQEHDDAIIRGVTGALDPFSKRAEQHADRYYGLIRRMTTDVPRISNSTGFSLTEIDAVKHYLFLDKHDLGERGVGYFDSDYFVAQSWQRLVDGAPLPHDLVLLRHELMEMDLVAKGIPQTIAHDETNKVYNYTKEAQEYYDSIKKHKT